jgi:hypothetical protein
LRICPWGRIADMDTPTLAMAFDDVSERSAGGGCGWPALGDVLLLLDDVEGDCAVQSAHVELGELLLGAAGLLLDHLPISYVPPSRPSMNAAIVFSGALPSGLNVSPESSWARSVVVYSRKIVVTSPSVRPG